MPLDRSMQKNIEKEFNDFKEVLKEYLEIQLDLEKLSLLEKLSRFGAYLFKIVIVVYFSIIIVGAFLGALAVWFGNIFNNYFVGVLIAGAGLFILAVILILMRKKIAVNSIVSNFSRIMLNDEEKIK